MASHAILSASSSHRWINCPPSVMLTKDMEDVPSEYAKEGSEAHELGAYLIEKALGKDVSDPKGNFEFYSPEMEECACAYAGYVLERYNAAKQKCADSLIYIEQRLDYSAYVKDGFGTGDCLIISDDCLEIIDYKHGLGVLVDANENSQLMCYALGAYDSFGALYDFKQISMTIFQPRRDNISTYVTEVDDLLRWANEVLMPAANLALEGKGEFKSGDHCVFCKAKAMCRKRAESNLELAKYDFKMPDTLEDLEISAILPKIEELVSWGNDVKEYALSRALSGVKFEGYKLVEGKSNRKYTDEEKVAKVVEEEGYDPYEKKLLGITDMTRLLGKKKFNELLNDYIVKPKGKITLVPESDARAEIKNDAKEDFKTNGGK